MDQSKLELQLKGYKHKEDTPMSPLVRSRLDETYASLLDTGIKSKSKAPRPWIRRTASFTAAAALLGVTVFASGFVSPVMAESLKQIPLVGSIFSSIEADLGLRAAGEQGLTSNVNSSVSYQDIQFKVTETVFDGTRAAFAVHVAAPNLKDGMYDTGADTVKLSNAIESIIVEINGKRSNELDAPIQGVSSWSAGEANPDMLIFEMTSSMKQPLPETFDASVYVRLAGIDHEFKLDVPVQKSTKDIVSLQQTQTKSNGNMTFSVSEINITPVTTRVLYSFEMDKNKKLDDKASRQFLYNRVAVFDDKGNLLPGLSGEGNGNNEGNSISWDYRFASTQSQPKYLILKPFVQKDGDFPKTIRNNQYIEGLEMKIVIPVQN